MNDRSEKLFREGYSFKVEQYDFDSQEIKSEIEATHQEQRIAIERTKTNVAEQENHAQNLEKFAQWFNENQWRGGKGDRVKGLFVKCDYPSIVKEFEKQQKTVREILFAS